MSATEIITRKVRCVGGYQSKGKRFYSYGLSLPPKWVDGNGLGQHGEVKIIVLKNRLIVVPSQFKSEELEALLREYVAQT